MIRQPKRIAFLIACSTFLSGLAYSGEPGLYKPSTPSVNCEEAQRNSESLLNSVPKALCDAETENQQDVKTFLEHINATPNNNDGSFPTLPVEKPPATVPPNRKTEPHKNNSRPSGKAIAPPSKIEMEKTNKNKLSNTAAPRKGTIFNDKMIPQVNKVSDNYYIITKRKLPITSGARTAQRQAVALIGRINKLGEKKVEQLYKNKWAIRQVLNVRAQHRNHRQAAITAITKTIENQMAQGVYLSRHLKSGAIDVSRKANGKALQRSVRQAGGSCFFEVDHWHVNLNPNG